MCETGGSRRTWLIGIDKVRKRHLMSAMAHNLGIVMRNLFGMGTARSLQAEGSLAATLYSTLLAAPRRLRQMLPAHNYVSFLPSSQTKTSFSIAVAS